jgi:hypothetical protein
LTSLQKQRKTPCLQSVQTQIDLIRLHCQFTKIQADKSWANPSEQVMTYLIYVPWEQALQVLTALPYNGQEISNLLKADRGKLWNRTTVVLRLNPSRRAVLAWAYLMLVVQSGEKRANYWLQEQPNINEETLYYLQDLLAQLNNEVTNDHESQIIGGVQQITQINNADWLSIPPQSDLKIPADKVWFQINVSAFHDGINCLGYPFSNFQLPKFQTGQFWQKILGIAAAPTMQIVVWHLMENSKLKLLLLKL